jgi:hypothetical protein
VIPDGHGLIPQRRHDLEVHFSPEDIEIGCSLEGIACIEQECAGVFATDLLDQSRAPGRAAQSRRTALPLREGIDPRVDVVGVQDRDERIVGISSRGRAAALVPKPCQAPPTPSQASPAALFARKSRLLIISTLHV